MARSTDMGDHGDGDGSSSSNVPLTTNVFALCELAAIEWRVYGADSGVSPLSTPIAHDDSTGLDTATATADAAAVASGSPNARSELHALFARLQQQQLLTVLEEPRNATSSSSDALPRVWLFVVNNGRQDFPAADALGELIEVDSGAWTRASEHALDVTLHQRLVSALEAQLTRALSSSSSDIAALGSTKFAVRDATFLYQCPSLSALNHFETYLSESLPTSTFALSVAILASVVCVRVATAVDDALLSDAALGDPRAGWRRLLGLPSATRPSLVDVARSTDSLAPRIVADTAFANVVPRFRAVATRRRHRRTNDDPDALDTDDTNNTKPELNDNDDDDDDDTTDGTTGTSGPGTGPDGAGPDGGPDSDDLLRRAAPTKRKRKKGASAAAANENDESVAPVSPDPHVNTPDAVGPTVSVLFPLGDTDADDNDKSATLRVDTHVNPFKRRRHKAQPQQTTSDVAVVFRAAKPLVSELVATRWGDDATFVKTPPVSSTLTTMRRSSSAYFVPPPSRTDAPATRSVAVSLVTSLALDEQHEALDARPHKSHPLLDALRTAVECELSADVAARALRAATSKRSTLPYADAFHVMRPLSLSSLTSVSAAAAERLRNNLLTPKFEPFVVDYTAQPATKRSNRVSKRERQRRAILGFDAKALDAYTRKALQDKAADTDTDTDTDTNRNDTLALGLELAATDALVVWRPPRTSRWTRGYSPQTRAPTLRETLAVVERVEPALQLLRTFLSDGGGAFVSRTPTPWLAFDEVAALSDGRRTTDNTVAHALEPPVLCVATADYSTCIPPPALSEYLLRGLHPVAAPKPVDYAIVCPHAPSEWLGSLALSYVTCFRSVYAQCHMGDHAPLDLATLDVSLPSHSVTLDATNALLLVDTSMKSSSSDTDAFAAYTAAGALLSPLLRAGVRATQAFARSAVAHVVYVVVPCVTSDVRHCALARGAFASGLFGTDGTAATWRPSVTIELLTLDVLYDVGVAANPFALMPRAFALFDRVSERVTLKPVDGDTSVAAAGSSTKTRFVSERLYHVAGDDSDTSCGDVKHIYAGYAVSADGMYVTSSVVDAVGSVLETHVLPRARDTPLEQAFATLMTHWLEFLALFGDRARLVIARVRDSDVTNATDDTDDTDDTEMLAWRRLATSRTSAEPLVPTQFASVVASVVLVHLRLLPPTELQLRASDAAALCVASDRVGFVATSQREGSASRDSSRRAVYARSAGSSVASSCFPRASSVGDDTVVMRVTVALDDLGTLQSESDDDDGSCDAGVTATDIERMLRDFHALSYLTMHPITTLRASPLPAHLAAVDSLTQDIDALALQLRATALESS